MSLSEITRASGLFSAGGGTPLYHCIGMCPPKGRVFAPWHLKTGIDFTTSPQGRFSLAFEPPKPWEKRP